MEEDDIMITEEIADDLLAFFFEGVDLFDYPAAIESVTREELEALATEYGKEP